MENKSNVIVTGSEGFIGRKLVPTIREHGHKVKTIDLCIFGGNPDIKGDVRSPDPKWFEGVDSVIHLAGVLGTEELFENPDLAVDVNVKGAINTLRACEMWGDRLHRYSNAIYRVDEYLSND